MDAKALVAHAPIVSACELSRTPATLAQTRVRRLEDNTGGAPTFMQTNIARAADYDQPRYVPSNAPELRAMVYAAARTRRQYQKPDA